ncbi:hypothetical protein [Rhodoblastus sp.]|uniref:hypothetical protein n=1 Tax=Rhodoblastus sp. TaxID=1962975 RepID=UPI0025FD2EB2|nr:hypothetical protein [Rhodoblastus sp.]
MNKPVNLNLAHAEAAYATAKAEANAALLERLVLEKRAARAYRSYKQAVEDRRGAVEDYRAAVEALAAAQHALWSL